MSESANIPKSADYSPYVTAFQNIASAAGKNGADSLTWAKDQVANNQGLTDQVNKGLLNVQGAASGQASGNAASSKTNLTQGDQYLRDNAAKYNDKDRQAADMGAAGAGVAQNFDAARTNASQQLESYGINPASTRFAALDVGLRAQQAAAAAGASNVARRTDDALADTANDKLVAQGNAEAGTANSSNSVANAAGTGAVSTSLGQAASGANLLGTGLAWTGAQTGANQGAVNTTNTGFSNSLESAKAENASSSGIGSLLGGVAGGVAGLSKNSLGGAALMAAFADGGPVPEETSETGPTTAGAVPVEASPSRGAVTDDVNAKLNAGEFVFPRDVSQWFGEEKLQKMILKARQDRDKATAKPKTAVNDGPTPQAPAFVSRPMPQQQGAVPA